MTTMTTPADISVQIVVPNDTNNNPPLLSAERRITPSWTISQLKSKLEPVTGIPASFQTLRTRGHGGRIGDPSSSSPGWVTLSDDSSLVGDPAYGLVRGSEIEILDGRPAAARQQFDFSDLAAVEKYQMPASQYEKLEDSVLAWKRRAKLGRFDPDQKSPAELAEERTRVDTEAVASRGITVGQRCRVGEDDARRGTVRFVGAIEGLGGAREAGCVWVGVELDEPVGRNDGSVLVEVTISNDDDDDDDDDETKGKKKEKTTKKVKVFECGAKFGVFARPEKVEVGEQYAPLGLDEDMEEV
ncbi:hypothetical protein, variant [Exophiala oligosperma]|uniref:CAP-Gly domain-containing protein n=1 Tax=Exophiala oligosperma TaxID=215243 RepID=A0A0D2D6A0_9EURO|nr:uncharacterized protein PV06_09877 [Exophiala oligosperma]XP_016258112.1 hypothetical protein, variant [Exophiala oligosperma]KIW37895.1 hypothetical protein PV06_09877 [Exophiala oligosperma]KIW37896.1 hypothetical protein, variant [Exophiala oligosperma]